MSIETIDVTPTWLGILPGLIAIIESEPTPTVRNIAMIEFRRMARLADQYVESQKEGT
jgi:hypothetical protein